MLHVFFLSVESDLTPFSSHQGFLAECDHFSPFVMANFLRRAGTKCWGTKEKHAKSETSEWCRKPLCHGLCNPVLLTHDLTHSFRAYTFSISEDPWSNFSFRIAYANRNFDNATRCQSPLVGLSRTLFRKSVHNLPLSRFSSCKHNSRTSPLHNFIMEVLDSAVELWKSGHLAEATSICCPATKVPIKKWQRNILWDQRKSFRVTASSSKEKPSKLRTPNLRAVSFSNCCRNELQIKCPALWQSQRIQHRLQQ